MNELRRESPRIDVETMCWEMIDGREASGLAVDLSSGGLRIERPYAGGPTRREVMLELEVPGIDEVMWARGDACFDVIIPTTVAAGGPMGLLRRTGYRIVLAARRDMRMLEEFVVETFRAQRRSEADMRGNDVMMASCYLRA